MQEIYRALQLGLGDYVRKNGFQQVVVGLSGGIDSALTAVIAADALGPEAVWGLGMPTRFSSDHSISDAEELAQRLGIRFDLIPIESVFTSYLDTLKPLFADEPFGVAEENLQARIRGALLMAVSNKFGPMVVATGNKSEMAAGYATIYGDMVGGYSALKDVFKTTVYKLAAWRNAQSEVIPQSSITSPPRRSFGPIRRTPTAFHPTTSSTRSSSSTSKRTLGPKRSSKRATTPKWCDGSPAWSIATSTSADRPRLA